MICMSPQLYIFSIIGAGTNILVEKFTAMFSGPIFQCHSHMHALMLRYILELFNC